MKKEDFKNLILMGIIAGLTSVIVCCVLVFSVMQLYDLYGDYRNKLAEERYESTPPDRRSGSFCPECKSTDVGRYVYGYLEPHPDSATAQAMRSGFIIGGGCAFAETYPKYKCNRCNYEWGNFK